MDAFMDDAEDYNGCFYHSHSKLTMHLGLTLPRYKKKGERRFSGMSFS